MIHMIHKYKRVLMVLIRIRFENLMMFRLGFWGPFIVDGSLFAIQLLAFRSVYANVDRIGGWGKGEMIIYIGTFSLLNAINMVIYFFGVNGIPEKIRSGDIDLYLTKPISPLFRISLERINPGSIPLVIFSFIIIGYGLMEANIKIGTRAMVNYFFWIMLMAVLYYDMEVILRSISFYIVSTAKLEQLEDAGLGLCMKLPGIAFYGIYKFIFCLLLPYGLMATLPVKSIIGEMTLQNSIYGVFIVILFTCITVFLWKTGIHHYNSTSS